MIKSIIKDKQRIGFYILGYIFGFLATFVYGEFSILKAFPVNAIAISASIGLGGALYYGIQKEGFQVYIPEILGHAFVSIMIFFISAMVVKLIQDSTSINLRMFIGM